MNTETALAHLEAFIAGGDELGEVSHLDALVALGVLRNELLDCGGTLIGVRAAEVSE